MPYTLILHVPNADPIVGEVDELPSRTDTLILLSNPRMRDGKDLPYITENVMTVLWPIDKVHFIEIMSAKDDEEIIGFVRE